MTDYTELVKALRDLHRDPRPASAVWLFDNQIALYDAAAAIEALQAENETLHQHIEDLNGAFRIESEARQKAEAAQPHWVSVDERLPKETKLVVTYGKSHVSFGYNLLLYDADTDKEVVEWFDYCGNRENVTHWMPLPEPPQEVQE